MKAITVRQPIASAIVNGPCRVLNMPFRVDDISFAIHASSRKWNISRTGMMKFKKHWTDCPSLKALPYGHIIGRAKVVGCFEPDHPRMKGNQWAKGPWCWKLGRVEHFRGGFKAPDKGGLWEIDRETMDKIYPPKINSLPVFMCECGKAVADVLVVPGQCVAYGEDPHMTKTMARRVCVYCAGLARFTNDHRV